MYVITKADDVLTPYPSNLTCTPTSKYATMILIKNGDRTLPKRVIATRETTKINENTIVSSFTNTFFIDWVKKKYPILANKPKAIKDSALLSNESLIKNIIPFNTVNYKNYFKLLLSDSRYI